MEFSSRYRRSRCEKDGEVLSIQVKEIHILEEMCRCSLHLSILKRVMIFRIVTIFSSCLDFVIITSQYIKVHMLLPH